MTLIATPHSKAPFDQAHKWQVGNQNGYYCGHNAMIFIKKSEMRRYDCPTVFNSKQEAEDFILQLKHGVAMGKLKNEESFHNVVPFSPRFMNMETIGNLTH